VADIKLKKWSIDSMTSEVQAVKDKKMGFLKDLLVRVLHSISSRIKIVTRNCFIYIYGHNFILISVKNYVFI
jgi:hypothetical protein